MSFVTWQSNQHLFGKRRKPEDQTNVPRALFLPENPRVRGNDIAVIVVRLHLGGGQHREGSQKQNSH